MKKSKSNPNDSPKKKTPIPIVVEVKISKTAGNFAFDEVQRFSLPLRVDKSYSPVFLETRQDLSFGTGSTEKDIFVIRGEVDSVEQMDEVRRHPEVEGVYRDDVPLEPTGSVAVDSDCDPKKAKGTLGDVAKYLQVDKIWNLGYTGKGIVIGIVDCGITAYGRRVKSGETSRRIQRVIGGYPFADWGTESSAWNQHGNMCATDALGIAPDAQLYDIRITDGGKILHYLSEAIRGIGWAISRHMADGTPHILSNSWALYSESQGPDYARNPNHPLVRAVKSAIREGIIVLFVAGNCGRFCPVDKCGGSGPGKSIWGVNGIRDVITVAAVNRYEKYIGYSSQGPAALDEMKPDLCSISHFQGYFPVDTGTSAACPVAAGVIALLKQSKPSIDQITIKRILMETAKDVNNEGWNPYFGAGILQPLRALSRLKQVSNA